ncbi:MAG: HAD family hydrolase [Bdellovibrionales bacterium]|nr:HAD family hydrolase [Bdellovibrionales bacterium]
MLSDIKLILFDLDGTLIEFHQDFLFDHAARTLELQGHGPVPRDHIAECFADFDFFRFVHEIHRETFQTAFWKGFEWDEFPMPVAIAGVLETLAALRQAGHDLGIVTSRLMCPMQLTQHLEPTGILRHTAYLRTRPGAHIDWSDKRESLREVIAEAGCEPTEVAMVGDIPHDIASAKDVGIRLTVGVLTGGLRRQVLEAAEPSLILNSVSELALHIKPK